MTFDEARAIIKDHTKGMRRSSMKDGKVAVAEKTPSELASFHEPYLIRRFVDRRRPYTVFSPSKADKAATDWEIVDLQGVIA